MSYSIYGIIIRTVFNQQTTCTCIKKEEKSLFMICVPQREIKVLPDEIGLHNSTSSYFKRNVAFRIQQLN